MGVVCAAAERAIVAPAVGKRGGVGPRKVRRSPARASHPALVHAVASWREPCYGAPSPSGFLDSSRDAKNPLLLLTYVSIFAYLDALQCFEPIKVRERPG